MKYLIPSERSDVGEFITHVFGNKILPMKHAVRHTALAPPVHIATQKLSITLKISELFFTSRQLLTESKFLLQLILVDKSQKNLKAKPCLPHRRIIRIGAQ